MTPRVLPDGRVEIRVRVRIDAEVYQRLVAAGRLLSVTPNRVFTRIVQRWIDDKDTERYERVFGEQVLDRFGPGD